MAGSPIAFTTGRLDQTNTRKRAETQCNTDRQPLQYSQNDSAVVLDHHISESLSLHFALRFPACYVSSQVGNRDVFRADLTTFPAHLFVDKHSL